MSVFESRPLRSSAREGEAQGARAPYGGRSKCALSRWGGISKPASRPDAGLTVFETAHLHSFSLQNELFVSPCARPCARIPRACRADSDSTQRRRFLRIAG
jgi:hypothetical protein